MYLEDLVEYLQLDGRHLINAPYIQSLLNPMFGAQTVINGSGLMLEEQYRNTRNSLLNKMVNIFGRKFPPSAQTSSGEHVSEDDDLFVSANGNYKMVRGET